MTPRQFETEYAGLWNELEQLLDQLEGRGNASTRRVGFGRRDTALPGARLAALYRRSCEQLALAQARAYPIHLTQRLEQLTQRAHQHIYRRQDLGWRSLQRWALVGFPQSVRDHRWYVLAAALLFVLPLLAVGWAAYRDSGFILHVMDARQVSSFDQMYDSAAESIGKRRTADTDWSMFGYYIMHNIGIGFQCFACGILLGLGSVYYLVYNGAIMGAVAGYLTLRGHVDTFYPFVVTHSAFELTAIVLSGAAGLRIGHALLAPGRLSRSAALQQAASATVPLLYGVIAMLTIAAAIEAFWSSARWVPALSKYAVGALSWALVLGYLIWQGRPQAPAAPQREPHAG